MSGAFGDILWTPSPERAAGTRLSRFADQVWGRPVDGPAAYADLQAWSVANPAVFWQSVWTFCGVVGDGPGDEILRHADRMPGAVWFPEARLNYAENLLQGDGAKEVLVFQGEEGDPRRLTRAELRAQTARVAAALTAAGVAPGDRVVGFLPNIPEAVIAMLAAASVGAVWSSCSPDFGVQGVLDRFGQIAPKVLLTADGYRYGGKTHDSLATARLLHEDLPSVEHLVVVPFLTAAPSLPPGAVLWDDFLAADGPAEPTYRRLPFDHPLFIMYSSGTTGLPKCMVHGAGGTLLQHLKEHQLHCDLGPGDRLFYYTTCGWMMWNWLVSGLASGAAVMLYDGHALRPEPVLWDFAAREGFTVFGTSARYLAACQKTGLAPGRTHDLSSLRCVLSTGSPLAPETFDYVYADVKADLQLSSISGGTDIISCFALGNPALPVRRGELQSRGLGMAVEVVDGTGQPVTSAKGELVCRRPFPSMPLSFWNDPDGSRYHRAYFDRFPGIWCHGDFAEITPSDGLIIHGRSDTVLNPGGVRIGTAEIYRIVEQFSEIRESLVVGQTWQGDVRVILFVVLSAGSGLDGDLADRVKSRLKQETSPRHVPALILAVPEIPRTLSGKLVELAVRNILEGRPVDNADALANPGALDVFRKIAETL